MDNKLEKIKMILIQQYSKLNGLSEQQMISTLENIDWTVEFKKLNKKLRLVKFVHGIFAFLIIVIAIAMIYNVLAAHTVILIFFLMIFFITSIFGIQTKIESKLRVLGLLFEIYR